MNHVYTGAKSREISFPLGGIGSGSIGLAGNGRLIEWEIFNRPNKKSYNGFSHFAIKAERDGRVLDARVLNGDMQGPYVGEPIRGGALHTGYGFGPQSQTMAGMPHFQKTEFRGEFPLAQMTFADQAFPGHVQLTAFNPFIPLQEDDSSIPAAFFEWEIENTDSAPITYTICLSAGNPKATRQVTHEYREVPNESGNPRSGNPSQGLHTLMLSSQQYTPDHADYGDITIATNAADCSYQQFWYRGGWCDNLEMFWHDFTQPGPLKNREYPADAPRPDRHEDTASLTAHLSLAAGEKKKVRFLISWSFPNVVNYWNPAQTGANSWKNYYALLFQDSRESATFAFNNWDRLYADTLKFKEALFASTLPPVVLDAVSANMSVLKTATSLRLTDGSFYGFEGTIADTGCCEGSCTHVWNYAYALPFLFPRLERSMRELDFTHNKREDGRMSFRLMLPVGRERSNYRACADGQFGGVIKAYRDWKISGDSDWLRSIWPAVKQSITYAWADTNEDRWDPMKRGVLEGRQHHTLDVELYGPNSWMTGFYLAALKAGAEMAAYLDEQETAAEWLRIFESGKQWADTHLFNGEYYIQRFDIKDRSVLEQFDEETVCYYWNAELGEMKYQIGEGCVIDQVVAQWHANLCGLGEIFDQTQTRKALQSLYRHNFKASMRQESNTWRLYSLNDEGGLVICTWPEGASKPAIPLTYNSETMTGFEYQAASHMIQEGFLEEGLRIVEAIRDRYDGEKRNPWNEIECGSNYARSMASYSLLQAFSGFEYDMVQGMIGFHPQHSHHNVGPVESSESVEGSEGSELFRTFWSLDKAWGTYEADAEGARLHVLGGKLPLTRFKLPAQQAAVVKQVQWNGITTEFRIARDSNTVLLVQPVTIEAEQSLHISF
ncbi:uncharacterized protein (DUF608 family) [Paenibacillus taihuensis]|uniref:Uncharacterized protein (DUF608 family) n=1 Tax=Paenibacillus taihuensis TaxID=1156355 RepID=A0A3D9R395_9BACL|nr:GH116 family glycosyl-hydrolase [Paenibacillus taihuensis]REE70542.1 uncharacterized protein (DUF608 family) [Paenibacillus taihuensis]